MSLAAYLPADRRRALAQSQTLPDRANGAALFADIAGFTPLTEALARALGPRLGAEELAHQLNHVYDALITEVNRYSGSVVFFSGDSITCWFDDGRWEIGAGSWGLNMSDVPPIPNSQPPTPAARRALACALAMQAAMRAFAAVPLPNGTTTILSLKVAIASGAVRRFVVGDAAVQCRDVLAGTTLDRLVAAEHMARPGEVVSDSATVAALGDQATVGEWRVGQESSERFAVIHELQLADSRLQSEGALAASQSAIYELQSTMLRPWLLPAVYERLMTGHTDLPIELRPATALLLRFGGLDYDGDAQAGSKLNGYVRWVQGVLLRYGGTLIDLTIGDKGCYFYCAFGAPATHENDAERALRAALELLVAPPELAWVGAIQIGISQGAMRTGAYGGAGRLHYGVLGDAVNTAARLMMATPPATIMVSQAAWQPCADLFIWEPLPPLRAKGKAEPLTVFRLVQARDQTEPDFYQGALIGREPELERLQLAARPIWDGQFAGMCYVDGEAGIGKSRLVYELRQRLSAYQPLQWFYCPTDEVLRGSLHPFARCLYSYFGQSSQASEAENRANFDAGLNGLIDFLTTKDEPFDEAQGRRRKPEGAGEPTPSSSVVALSSVAAELERTRSILGALIGLRWEGSLYEQLEPKLRFENTLYAVANLIKAASLRAPVLIELEDGHWLDPDTQELISMLSRTLPGYAAVFVCAARPDDDGRPFRLGLAKATSECAIDLGALAVGGVRVLAAQVLGADVSDELAAFLFDKTAGNPFFVEQVALDLRERGLLENQEAVRGIRFSALGSRFLHEVPAGVNAVLVARLDRLAAPVREVVQTASVLGREWPLQVLWGILGDDRSLPGKVRQAEQGQVWAHMGEMRYLFRHVLLRDAAYDMQARARLRELHGRAAQAIEAEYIDNLASQYANLVYHSHEAEDGERERRYAKLAGEAAAARYANEAAVDFLGRALILTPENDLEARWELIQSQVRVYEFLGRREMQAADLDALDLLADALGDDRRRAEGALLRAQYLGDLGSMDEAVAFVERAVALAERAGARELAAESHFRWARLLQETGDFAGAEHHAYSSLELAIAGGDQRAQADALYALGVVHLYRGDYTAAREVYERSLTHARQSGDLAREAMILSNLAVVAFSIGDEAENRRLGQRCLQIQRSIGNRVGEARALNLLGGNAFLRGDFAEARAYIGQGLPLAREIRHRQLEALFCFNLSIAAYNVGAYVEAQGMIEQSITIRREINDRRTLASSLGMLSTIEFALGNYAGAEAHAHEKLQISEEIGSRPETAIGQLMLGQVLRQQGRLNEAEETYSRALALARELGARHESATALAELARVALARGTSATALAYIEETLTTLAEGSLNATQDLIEIYSTCYQVLRVLGDPRASEMLAKGHALLQERAACISDDALRRSFLEKVPYQRELVAAWREHQAILADQTVADQADEP